VRVFVDTSALFALLDEDDSAHGTAAARLTALRGSDLVTHAYVLVETLALVSRRLGRPAVTRLLDGLLAVVAVEPVDAAVHSAALADYRGSDSTAVSFVDRTSFAFMRAAGIGEAFAFDEDFLAAGFDLLR
jgi:uncharacterized protein